MRRRASLVLLLVFGAMPAIAAESTTPQALLDRYCLDCHNFDENAAGLSLTAFDSDLAHEDVVLGEKLVRKLRAGMMPPAGKPRPDFETLQGLARHLERRIDAHPAKASGWPRIHRLNRAEYANVVRDLLGIPVDAARLLPADDSSEGFDNQAGALTLSPVLLQAYLNAAGELSRLAVGRIPAARQVTYRVPQDETQNYPVEGLPLGTRGGTLLRHVFPASGQYRIKVFAVNLGNMGNFRPFGEVRGEQLEILLDGRRVGKFDWDKEFAIGSGFFGDGGELRSIDLSLDVPAGVHEVGVTFEATNLAPGLDLNKAFDRSTIETGGLPGFTFYPHIGSVRIDGPHEARAGTQTESRRRVFICSPARAREELPCARRIIERLTTLAYRGTGTRADRDVLLGFFREGRKGGGFDAGIEAVVQRLLSDPRFILRVGGQGDDLEMASRLSFFLWSSIPDEELLQLAGQRRLHDPVVLRAQVTRMLADPRASAFAENFAGQWLSLRSLDSHFPVVAEFPDFDNNLRQALRQEGVLFFDSVLRENRSVLDLLTADYTFVNERLARHYGIAGIRGSRFRKVQLVGPQAVRRGILGKGAVLAVSSQPGRTSPVMRGNWVLANLIGVPAPPPPPDVPLIEPKTADAAGNSRVPTMRQQYEQHRVNPACAGCHMMMDPIGFALEPFDAIGGFRTLDAGNPIDASGEMYDGTPIRGPEDLTAFLVKYREQFVRSLTERLVTYAMGRGVEPQDMPQVRAIVEQAATSDYRFQGLIGAIVTSPLFSRGST